MFFQEEISAEAQQKWYDSIMNQYNYYFVIEYQKELVGLINGKHVDYNERKSEGGIFIWDRKYQDSIVPVIATVCLAEITFNVFFLNETYAEVRGDNQKAIQYNKQLGYTLHSEEEGSNRQVYVLTKTNYEKRGVKIKRAVEKLTGDTEPMSWADFDFSDVSEIERVKMYTGLPPYIQEEVDKKLS
jgi:RimJ/RimL family protein N-acetyltransferase